MSDSRPVNCICAELRERYRKHVVDAMNRGELRVMEAFDRLNSDRARWLNGDTPIPLCDGKRVVASGTLKAMHAANRLLRCDPFTPPRPEYMD